MAVAAAEAPRAPAAPAPTPSVLVASEERQGLLREKSSAGDLRKAPAAFEEIGLLEPMVMATIMLSQIGLTSLGLLAVVSRLFGVKRSVAAYVLYMVRSKFSKTQSTGGRPWISFKQAAFWNWHARYFSASLVRTAEVPAQEKPYVFACHPHGVLALAMPPNFASDGSHFSKQFPGIDLRVAVANLPLYLPVARQIALWSGCISADKNAIEYSLKHGQSVAIVVGGPDEALLAGTGKMRLVLKDRLGFVKTAVQTGADLVPILTYGENEAFRQLFPTFIKRMQVHIVKNVGISLPLFYGCGLYGTPMPLPERVRLISVVGAPVRLDGRHCDQKKDPARFEQLCREVHAEYMEALRALHAATHEQYGSSSDHELDIISVQQARSFSAGEEATSLPRSRL
eukprot:TRINITY_DN11314_c0_g1_i1.p1 TRINITY_DN11314_c0_g1~~TRINITY_DN11314_c0_g1_i1.p1  ORF type:complete len:435 (-),score=74.70 TRINITY_DN11314_c0_g1_i1:222-1415(-)